MPDILLEQAITYQVGDEVTHAPMVEATVGGVRTQLIVDTGSDAHVFTLTLARAAGLPLQPGEEGTDSAGASVPSWSLGDVNVTIGGLELALRDGVAIAGPEPFERWGVGGILSAQHLHPTANVVLDLVDQRLQLMEGETAATGAWLAANHPTLTALQLERQPGAATILVLAALAPHEPVTTLMDTGGKATEFAEAAVPGLVGAEPTVTGHGVGGTEVLASLAENQKLLVGESTVPLHRVLLRPSLGDANDGLIGMDVLRGTVLMVAADTSRPVLWLIPH